MIYENIFRSPTRYVTLVAENTRIEGRKDSRFRIQPYEPGEKCHTYPEHERLHLGIRRICGQIYDETTDF